MSENDFRPLDPTEVIIVSEEFKLSNVNSTCTVEEFCASFSRAFRETSSDFNLRRSSIVRSNGVPCKALRFGNSGWQSGRIRFTLEFCPDEPAEIPIDVPLLVEAADQSPLDSIRQLSSSREG